MFGASKRVPAMLAAGAAATALGLAFAPSCSQTPPVRNPLPPQSAATEAAPPVAANHAAPAIEKAHASYADAIRQRQFKRAAVLIDSATETEQNSPEVLYARALCALELTDIETALRLSDKLEKTSTLFKTEAAELRTRAAHLSRDITLLVHFLAESKNPEDQLLLAEAHEQNANVREAREIADKVLTSLQKSKHRDVLRAKARAHLIKARTLIVENKKSQAAREYHWLATDGASLDEAGEFDEKAEVLDPTQALNKNERLARIEAFSEKGRIEQTEAEIEALKKLSPAAAAPVKTDHHLAWAVFNSRSDYLRAAQLFASAAAHGGADKNEYLYYEAKALARSHRDREAIGKYEIVATLGGKFADHAAYQAARLRFIDGQWKAAVTAYETYLKRYGRRAKHREGAESDLGIARLAAGDYHGAYAQITAQLKAEKSPRIRARLMQLQGVAKLGEKKEAEAASLFREAIEYRPLSFPALLAAARLREMKLPVPPPIAPARTLTAREQSTPPLKLSLPEKVWRLSRVGLDEEAEEALITSERVLRLQFGARAGEALCRMYGQLESAKRRYQIAQTAASWAVLKESPCSATAWQWDCIYPTPYHSIVTAEAKQQRISPSLVYGVMRQESAFRPTVVSPARAVGLMQIIPPTAEKVALGLKTSFEPDLMRAPAVNIRFGAYYLRYLMDLFAGRPELVLASYNAGPQAVSRWLRAGENLPLDVFVAQIPYSETRNYVYRVMGNYARYAYYHEERTVLEVDLALPKGLKIPADAY